jgi:hypothetical protein
VSEMRNARVGMRELTKIVSPRFVAFLRWQEKEFRGIRMSK